ncbi:TetR/AcrR family transcriptional regulator [Kribbella sp. NPDC048928]|uniref:TetR/AcrR family transcriptional regulator n=1 Tax=Kribbella sp. NPDC048928 TaxID=3364111 RepID=UPI00371B363A
MTSGFFGTSVRLSDRVSGRTASPGTPNSNERSFSHYTLSVPKTSERYRDARREHILNAARRAFLRNGFHATSMHDLFAEAGLSSGAVYRYFAGKDEVVLAIAEDNIRQVGATIRAVTQERTDESIGAALAAAVELLQAKDSESGLAGIGVQAWAEALRNPKIGIAFGEMLATLRAEIAEAVARHQEAGGLPAEPSAEALANVMIANITGFILQLALLGSDAVADFPQTLKTLWPPVR